MENPATWTELDRVIAAAVTDGPPSQVAGAVLAAVAANERLAADYAPPSQEYVEMAIKRYRDNPRLVGLSLPRSLANLFVKRKGGD